MDWFVGSTSDALSKLAHSILLDILCWESVAWFGLFLQPGNQTILLGDKITFLPNYDYDYDVWKGKYDKIAASDRVHPLHIRESN